MKRIAIFLLTLFSFIVSAQNAESDTTIQDSIKSIEKFRSEKDVKFDVERKNNRTYVNHYKYRFAISPFVSEYNIKGNNKNWRINSSSNFAGIDFKANTSIYKNHKVNLSGSYSFTTSQNTIDYFHQVTFGEDNRFNVNVYISDLGYSYLYDFTQNDYFEFGSGVRFMAFNMDYNQFKFSDGLGFYLNVSYLRRLSEQFILLFDFSYSQHDFPSKINLNNRAKIILFQFKFGIQFLTVVSEMYY